MAGIFTEMDVHYISPSTLPSRSANSVHVIHQTRALADTGACVTLYACRSLPEEKELLPIIERQYGVAMSGVRLVSTFTGSCRGSNLRIAALALPALFRVDKTALIISRNLYVSYVLAVFARRPIICEIHDVEMGIRGRMQRAIIRRPWVRTVTISEKLAEHLRKTHKTPLSNALILHDAAPSGIEPMPPGERRQWLATLVSVAAEDWHGTCGYIGHLYPGRGMEIIEALATMRPDVLFIVVGGQDADVRTYRSRNLAANLIFLGHMPHPQAIRLASNLDVLLMPYQANVSIGLVGHDTARWMSPMKMFEYLASGVPVISSDLPVLREVLRDGENCLLVSPSNPQDWAAALDRLLVDKSLGERLGMQGHADYLAKHTWGQRARRLLMAAETLK